MRIGHVSPFFYPVIGGWEEAIYNKSRECLKLGHEAGVLTCNELHDRTVIPRPAETIDGIAVQRFPVKFHLSNFYRVWPGFVNALPGNDVLHLHNFRHYHVDAALAWKRKKNPRQKIVLRAGSPFHPKSPWLAVARAAYDRLLARRVFKGIDALLAYHETERRRFIAMGCPPEKIRVIPFGVNASYFEPGDGERFRRAHGLDGDARIVLNVGRLHYYKEPETLVRAAAKLEDPKAKVVFVGDGDPGYVAGLKRLAEQEDVREKIVFVPGTSDKQALRDAYAAADLFVLPSVYEPFGIVVLEALAQGKPVLSTPYDGPKHILNEDCGAFFEPGDHERLAFKANQWLADPGLARRLGQAGREKARAYAWDKLARKVVQVYDEVLG